MVNYSIIQKSHEARSKAKELLEEAKNTPHHSNENRRLRGKN